MGAKKKARKPHTQVPHAERKADGRVRVDVYVPRETGEDLDVLVETYGSKRDAVIAAITELTKKLGDT